MIKHKKTASVTGEMVPTTDEKYTETTENSLKKNTKTVNSFKRRKKMTKKKLIFLIIAVIAALAAAYYLYTLFFVKEEKQAITGKTSYGSLNKAVEGSGTTEAADSVTYSLPSAEAAVIGWYAEAGDTVQAGDLLFEQDDSDIDEKIMVLRNGDANTNGIADYQTDISEQEAAIGEYESELEDYREDLGSLVITAPYDGYLTYVADVEAGDSVKGGMTLLATYIDDSKMELTQYFSYSYKDEVYVGMPADVSVASQMLSLEGVVKQVSYVERVTENGMRCFKAVIEVDNPGSLTNETTAAAVLVCDDGTTIYPTEFNNDSNTLSYADSEDIYAEADGELLLVSAEQYQRVSEGTLLFQIDSTSVEENINRLEAKITQAKNQIDKDKSWIESLEEQIADLEESREEYKRYSEISGKVISSEYTQMRNGMYVGSVTIYSMDTMSITVSFDELDVDYLTEGMPVTVYRTSAEKRIEYDATLTYLSLEATSSDEGVSTFEGTITIDSKGELASGVTVYYFIDVGDSTEGVLAPVNALKSTEDGTYYMIVQADKAPENTITVEGVEYPDGFYPVCVEAGSSNSSYVYITSGVEAGTTVFLRYMSSAPSNGDKTSSYDDGSGDAQRQTDFSAFPSPPAGMGDFSGGMGDFSGGPGGGFGGG
jgi:multidrug efflux pump subunit AcrA (membrane-fusion protein)